MTSELNTGAAGTIDLSGKTILQVVPELNAGGVERGTIDVAAAIVKAGGRALVASCGGRMEKELLNKKAQLIRLDMKSKNPVTIFRNGQRLADLIIGEKVDLIHARSRAPAWSALRASRKTAIPFVTTYHGTYNAGNFVKRFYNSVMARGDAVIAISDHIRKHMITEHHLGVNNITLIPRGIDAHKFDQTAIYPERLASLASKWDVDSSKFTILLPGRLTRWKGQMIMLQALNRLVKDAGMHDLLCLMVGDDQGRSEYLKELQDFVITQGLEDNVRIVGHSDDMAAVYGLSDLVVCPSIEPEAFGRVPVEAQAMGRPIIASAHGGAMETVIDGETGLLVEAGNPEALAEAIKGVRSLSEEERNKIAHVGRDHVLQKYTVETMCSATLMLYGQLMLNHSRYKE